MRTDTVPQRVPRGPLSARAHELSEVRAPFSRATGARARAATAAAAAKGALLPARGARRGRCPAPRGRGMRARLRAGAADPSRSVIERAAEEAVLRFQLDCDRDTDSSDGEGAGRAGLGACQSGAGLSQRVEEAARAHGSSEAPASGTVASVASPPRRWPSRRLAGAGFAASASKDSYVDRLVAREIEQARASADESARSATRLRARADQLRREAAQLVVGSHGGERACKDSAATGRGRKLCARRMTERELGAAFEWMRLDQTLPAASAVRFWDKAAESLMELFEGDAAAAAAAKSRAGGGSAPSPPQRLYGYFNADGGANAVPLGFAALKVDGASVDVMGVRVDARGGGVGQAIVEHLLELANGRALRMREEQVRARCVAKRLLLQTADSFSARV